MTAYLIVDIEIIDHTMYCEYIARVPEIMKRFGGRYLIHGGRTISLSGGWQPDRLIMVEFDSRERIEECLASADYRALAPLRERSTGSRALIAENGHGEPLLATVMKQNMYRDTYRQRITFTGVNSCVESYHRHPRSG